MNCLGKKTVSDHFLQIVGCCLRAVIVYSKLITPLTSSVTKKRTVISVYVTVRYNFQIRIH